MAGSHDDPYLDGLTEQGQSLSGNNGHRAFLAPTDDGGCEMLNLTASLVIASLAEGSPRSSTDSLERVAVTLKLFSPTDLKGNVEPKLSKPRLGKIGQENATWIEKSQITEHNFTNYTQKTKLSNDSFLSEAATQEPPPLTLKELMENNPFLAGLNRRVRDRIIRQLKNITKEIIHLILDRGWNGEDSEADLKWSMEGAVLYAVTVITTIGKNRIISILLKQNHRFSIP
ncbi:unnamed protein product [Protopolystoma xenopodis]|uniref:Uncharacterized protein n=1 Tax=Protopolystoma xenopodis TaxID=117903 RepID=A0A448XI63_9PLAT|nr:unnamed protein product [Protopolystoma xenopodis]